MKYVYEYCIQVSNLSEFIYDLQVVDRMSNSLAVFLAAEYISYNSNCLQQRLIRKSAIVCILFIEAGD